MIDIEKIQVGFRRKDYGGREASTFWRQSDFGLGPEFKGSGHNHTKLAATQRAIANFVNIVTGKQIPVIFKGQESYTNGERVVISTKLEGDRFDPTVGLALHEASHITLTDFKVLRNLEQNIRLQGLDPDMNMSAEKIAIIQNIFNWVEDRRIDYHSYMTAPGYRMYYEAMYDTYFNAKIIDKALINGEMCNETWDDYLFHIINFTNPHRDLDTLEVLRDVWNLVRLGDISRLKSTRDAFVLACDIFRLIDKHIEEKTELENAIQKQKDFLDGKTDKDDVDPDNDCNKPVDSCPNGKPGGDKNNSDAGGPDDGSKAEGEDSDDNSDDDSNSAGVNQPGNNQGKKPKKPLSERQRKQLAKAIKNQRDFVDGEHKKEGRAISKKDDKLLKSIRESGTEIVTVNTNETFTSAPRECLVIRKINRSIMENFPRLFNLSDYGEDERQRIITSGIVLGKQLGRKLTVRNEDRTLKQTRLDAGKIDRRLVAQLGAGAEAVFHRIVQDEYKNFFIHISIDASGSMGGLSSRTKFGAAVKSAVAVAQAASMTKGIRVQISLRGTTRVGDKDGPGTIYVYDSKTDKMNKISRLFKHLQPFGCTPEGVAFKSIEKFILQDAKQEECLFINYSDGMPSGYCENPIQYTAKVMKRFREQGIQILSYFVSNSSYENKYVMPKFKEMYGKDAAFINPTKLPEIARTLNQKFLEQKVG